MWERLFLARLRKELPLWVERGWVDRDNQHLILEHVTSAAGGVRRGPIAFAVLGVLMFGAGTITFFASNWQEIGKVSKLALLFGAMWSAYAAAGWFLTREDKLERGFGHALLLLGIILFGANIMLIAQIYHIEADFPMGLLLWTLGALLVVYLAPTELAAVAGIGIAALWSGSEIVELFDSDRLTVHWPFLVVWLLFLPQIYRQGWQRGARFATLTFVAWGVANLVHLGSATDSGAIIVVQLVVAGGLSLFLVGAIMDRSERLLLFAGTLRRIAGLTGLVGLYVLSLRGVNGLGATLFEHRFNAPSVGWVLGTMAAAVLAIALAAFLLWRTKAPRQLPHLWWGLGIAAAMMALFLANLFKGDGETERTLAYIAANAVFVAAILWLVYAGYRTNDGIQVNLAFVFFSAWILTLYFDTFWTLMDRSSFFMGGGAILFVGGYLLHRQRRRLLRRIAAAPPGAAA